MTRSLRRLCIVWLVLASVVVSGCGSDDAPAGEAADPAGHNAADVSFATEMVPHHAQALSMVDLTLDRRLSPQVQALTEQIRDAQAPEIELMVDWLEEWGEPVPETMRDHANAHAGDGADDPGADDHGADGHGADGHGADTTADSMPGMLSADELDGLAAASETEFEPLWLESMIAHHQGAIEMAQVVVDEGQNADVAELAQAIIDGQTAEIATMRDLLGQ